jgi:NAD(P)-dependent dehydrogenase (short-subunit alcohol dehydrogenase family)
VRDEVQLDRLIDTTLERFERIDILVNNAGGQPLADIATASPRFIRAINDLNLVAPIVFSIKVYQVMKVQDSGGSIINISSQASMIGDGGRLLAPYGAAKAGPTT